MVGTLADLEGVPTVIIPSSADVPRFVPRQYRRRNLPQEVGQRSEVDRNEDVSPTSYGKGHSPLGSQGRLGEFSTLTRFVDPADLAAEACAHLVHRSEPSTNPIISPGRYRVEKGERGTSFSRSPGTLGKGRRFPLEKRFALSPEESKRAEMQERQSGVELMAALTGKPSASQRIDVEGWSRHGVRAPFKSNYARSVPFELPPSNEVSPARIYKQRGKAGRPSTSLEKTRRPAAVARPSTSQSSQRQRSQASASQGPAGDSTDTARRPGEGALDHYNRLQANVKKITSASQFEEEEPVEEGPPAPPDPFDIGHRVAPGYVFKRPFVEGIQHSRVYNGGKTCKISPFQLPNTTKAGFMSKITRDQLLPAHANYGLILPDSAYPGSKLGPSKYSSELERYWKGDFWGSESVKLLDSKLPTAPSSVDNIMDAKKRLKDVDSIQAKLHHHGRLLTQKEVLEQQQAQKRAAREKLRNAPRPWHDADADRSPQDRKAARRREEAMSTILMQYYERRQGLRGDKEAIADFVSRSFVTIHRDMAICSHEDLPAFYQEVMDRVAEEDSPEEPAVLLKMSDAGRPLFELLVHELRSRGINSIEFMKLADDESGGTLTCEELRRGMARVGISIPEDEVQKLFQELDADGSNSVSFMELRQHLEQAGI